MKLTFTVHLKGFDEWIKIAESILLPLFTSEVQEEFETFEDFAAEVYLETKVKE